MELIDPSTEPGVLRRAFDQRGHLSGYRIDPELTATQLESIVGAHAAQAHWICVVDLVVAHPHCNAAVIDFIIASSGGSSEILDSVITSGKASVPQLIAIRDEVAPAHSDHLTMALLEHELRDAPAEVFERVLERHRDDEALSYPVRYRLATHERAPISVLQSIAAYRDPTGEAARRRLAACGETLARP